jgi:dephospho-CoA kinase
MLFNVGYRYRTKKGKAMNADKLVIGLAGMPGSGKSIVVEVACEMGFALVVMGDVVRQETLKLGLELTPQNVGKVMLQLREEGGSNIIAEKCIPKIIEQKSPKVIVDGLRSLNEADAFKARFSKFNLVAVHASPETRFARLFSRRRSDDPDGWGVFYERDLRELSVGLGNVIAMAQHVIVNDNSVEQFKIQVKNTLQRIEEKWKK